MKARILIVEDESIVQFDLQNRLTRFGHAVVGSAVSGEEAIQKAAELKPDLVLMDVQLEGPMDGIEAAAQIRAARAVKILFITAYPTVFGDKPDALLHPRIAKPFVAKELQAAIAQALTNPAPGVAG